ncbi:glycosyltransferase family 39 protein [Kordia jejudonensis]|uniref:glycosyltransferase family 39 protein n=1 Tax=Kordia jejudonensis TaxID=1348245 RepID=UPI0006293C97|nr:glycosyltransferase family 39 protein [Kordia jejudonensis]
MGILFLIAFIWILRRPVNSFPDSTGYLNMMINRTPGYPIFLKLIESIFGSNFETAVCFIQTVIGCFSIYFFIQKIRSVQLLNEFYCCCLSFALLLPFVFGIHVANNILTEAISYALYLIVVGNFIAFFISKNKKELYYALPILSLLLITRYQFIYLIPVALVMIFWINFKEKQWKTYRLIIILICCLPIATSLVDRTYHKIVHNHFVSTPWTGMNIITAAFYVSNAEDEAIFGDAAEKQFFQNTYQDLAKAHLNIHHLERNTHSKTEVYINEFANITMGPIFKNGNAVLDPSLSEDEKYIALEKMTKSMSTPLILDNFSEWTKLYIGNLIFGFGGIKFVFLYLIILLSSIIGILKYNTKIYKILLLLSMLFIGNLVLVSVGMHAIVRFTFYNDWVLFLTIFILLNSLNKKIYES